MGWFWKKKEEVVASPADAATAQVVTAAMQQSSQADREWRALQERQQREEKRRNDEIERTAKLAAKEMKKQVKAAKKEQAKAVKLAKKQAKSMMQLQKREVKHAQKQAKKQAKEIKVRAKKAKRARQDEDKRRKRTLRQRQKERKKAEKQRRKQSKKAGAVQLEQEELARQLAEAQRETDRVTDPTQLREPPKFQESAACKSCSTTFKRLPTYRRHHCRNCGESFCGKCLSGTKRAIPWFNMDKPQKVCFTCDVQVFNGMGGLKKKNDTVPSPVAQSGTVPQSAIADRPPLYRTASSMSEQPEDDSPRSSSKGSGRFIGLRLRSRRDHQTSSKTKKNSWTLPSLKRKASADQVRNRAWDLDLLVEKEAMLARQRQSQAVNVPRFAQAV